MKALGGFAVLLAALGLPLAARAQDPRLRERLDPATAARVEALVDSARRVGLPTEPLVQKALEGKSKGADPQRIVGAAAALLGGLERARTALGSASSADELVAAALWIRLGGADEDLAALRAAAPGRSLVVPLGVSAELIARGWPPAGAGSAVGALLKRRVSDQEFLALRDRIDRAVRNGADLDRAAKTEIARLTTDRTP